MLKELQRLKWIGKKQGNRIDEQEFYLKFNAVTHGFDWFNWILSQEPDVTLVQRLVEYVGENYPSEKDEEEEVMDIDTRSPSYIRDQEAMQQQFTSHS